MKKFYILFTLLIAALVLSTNVTFAQAPAAGPSEPTTTAPPTTAGAVGKVLCNGSPISLSGPDLTPGTPYPSYQWYKRDQSSGSYLLVSGMTGKTYTENATTTSGYYDYKVVTVNSNGCSSPASSVFQVFVLPVLTATISTPSSAFCADGATTTLLTANVTAPTSGYSYTYQWTLGGTNISGATNSTYTVPTQTTAATLTYGVIVSYVLNNSCTATASQVITINALPSQPTITAN